MYTKCLQQGIRIRKEVRIILSILGPVYSQARQTRCLRRRQFIAQGHNFIWHKDSYDKLKPYGICINGNMDGFSRKIMWLKLLVASLLKQLSALEGVPSLCGLRLARRMRWWEIFSSICRETVRTNEQQNTVKLQGETLQTSELKAGGEWWERREQNTWSHFQDNSRMKGFSPVMFWTELYHNSFSCP